MYENETSHAWYIATRELMYGYLNMYLKPGSKVLDAGCGTGGTIEFLKQKSSSWNLYGVDASTEALKYCKKRRIKNIREGNINKLPFKNNLFDAVICLDVICQEGVNDKAAITEFNRVLKKGGKLYVQEPAHQILFSKHDRVVMTKHRYNKNELVNLISKYFVVKKCSYFNFFLLPLIFLKRILDKKTKTFETSDVSKLHPTVNSTMLIILKLESSLINHFSLPIGLTIICLAKKN